MLMASQNNYGSDENGLICGYRFRPEQPAEPVGSATQALQDLAGPSVPGGFVWLHLNLSHAGALAWMRAHAGLSENFFDALHEGSRSTRIERDGDTLFAVINDVTFDFSFDASDVATLWLAVSEHAVISARSRPLRAIDRLRTAVKRGETLRSSAELLDHLLRDQADELQRVVRGATSKVDDIEDAMLDGRPDGHGTELSRLRRLMVRLQRLLAPEPSALQRTLARPPRWLKAADLQDLNGSSEEFALVLGDIAALQERIKLMQDESQARVAEENNRTLFTLTMVTVLALPINLISGLFGMNVGGIPLADHGHGFWTMLGIIGAATVGLALLVRRKIRPRKD